MSVTNSATVGVEVGVEAAGFSAGASSSFTTEVSASTNFNVESSDTKEWSVSDATEIEVEVPANEATEL